MQKRIPIRIHVSVLVVVSTLRAGLETVLGTDRGTAIHYWPFLEVPRWPAGPGLPMYFGLFLRNYVLFKAVQIEIRCLGFLGGGNLRKQIK